VLLNGSLPYAPHYVSFFTFVKKALSIPTELPFCEIVTQLECPRSRSRKKRSLEVDLVLKSSVQNQVSVFGFNNVWGIKETADVHRCFHPFHRNINATGCAFLSRIVPISIVTSLSMRERNRAISSVASV
jgi:hypothetical protein